MRNEEADEGGTVEWAGEVEGTAAGAEELVAASVCDGGVSEGSGLFLPEETGEGGEGGLGIVRTEWEPQDRDHLLVDICGDCGRKMRSNFPDQINMIRSRSTFGSHL